jgi:selenide,water dikinase
MTSMRPFERSDDALGASSVQSTDIDPNRQIIHSTTWIDAPVDDGALCGAIAVAAGLLPLYARGGQPMAGSLLVGLPKQSRDNLTIEAIFEGARKQALLSGIRTLGLSVIGSEQPSMGFAGWGERNPGQNQTTHDPRSDDLLIVSKPLGAGLYAGAHRRDLINEAEMQPWIEQMLLLDKPGLRLHQIEGIKAIIAIDATGLVGALYRLCGERVLTATVHFKTVPSLSLAYALARRGVVAEGAPAAWNRYGARVKLDDATMPEHRALLCDPQVNGGFLIACQPEIERRVLEELHTQGFREAQTIGRLKNRANLNYFIQIRP